MSAAQLQTTVESSQQIPTQTLNTIQNLQSCEYVQIFMLVLFLIGMVKICTTCLKMISPLSFFPYDLRKRYYQKGGKSWAVITGASQGIGFAFAEELALKGFNIVMMSRSITKLEKAKQEIIAKMSDQNVAMVEILLIPVDFQKTTTVQDYQQLMCKLQGIDIAILVNNVGYYVPYRYQSQPYEEINRQAIINILPITFLTRLILPLMLERNKKSSTKSAIINLSSGSAQGIVTNTSHYSATKSYDDQFSRSLVVECQGQGIDLLTLRPYLVTSAMTRKLESMLHVSPKQCVKGALADLGRCAISYGHWSHRIQGVVADQFEGKLVRSFIGSEMKKISQKYKEIDSKSQ